jgi:hypothetical protein
MKIHKWKDIKHLRMSPQEIANADRSGDDEIVKIRRDASRTTWRTARAAACFVCDENIIFEAAWAGAEWIATLPDHLQDPSVAVGSTDDDPRHAHWAAPEVLRACQIEIVHETSPPGVLLARPFVY